MDTKLIKQKILDLAIRGKLVPQNPADEPASVLLERIKAEKAQLIKEGKIKKEKPLPPIEEIPFEIPESWEWCRLSDFVLCVTDGDHQAPPQSKDGIPFLVISDVNKGIISFEKARFVPEEYYQSIIPSRIASKGDILFTVTGSYGIVIPVNTDRRFCFQRHIGLIKTITSNDWLTYVLKSHYVQKYCDEVSTGTAQKTVSLSSLRELIIPVPSAHEQKRIVAEIDRWFKWIDELEQNQQDLHTAIKQAKSKILDLAIHGKLVPQDVNDEPASILLDRIRAEKAHLIKEGKVKKEKPLAAIEEVPFEIPESWEWCKIRDISSQILYGVSESAKSSGSYKLLRITDIQDNKVNWDTVPYTDFDKQKVDDYLLSTGDILFARTGATVGKSYLVVDTPYPAIYASYLIRVKTSSLLLPNYVKYFFESGYYWEQISDNSIGTGQPNVNGTVLSSINIPMPPQEEQKRIVTKIEELFAQLDKIEESLN